VADRLVPLTYAIDGEQSSVDMHRCKDPMSEEQRRGADAWQRLALRTARIQRACSVPSRSDSEDAGAVGAAVADPSQ
jgi:hypothetical protein